MSVSRQEHCQKMKDERSAQDMMLYFRDEMNSLDEQRGD